MNSLEIFKEIPNEFIGKRFKELVDIFIIIQKFFKEYLRN
jgi:hypothetical protein